MSDRRSFSEIPAEVLEDHGDHERVDRVWKRLHANLEGGHARRRSPIAPWLVVSAATFALGIFVGAKWLGGAAPGPVATVSAEPRVTAKTPAAPAAKPTAEAEAALHEAPRAHQSHRVAAPRRADDVVAESPALPLPSAQAAPLEWQRLADEGQYVQALASLEATGGFDAALREANAEELMSLVDVARATGQRDRAIVALRRIVSEHGSDPNAPVAAWMLGNELAKTGALAEAEQAFAMYRALSPSGDFAEDALARQVDMAAEQGNLDHARKLAGQYLKEFPDGPRSADMQVEIEQWSRSPGPSSSAAEPEVRPSEAPSAAPAPEPSAAPPLY